MACKSEHTYLKPMCVLTGCVQSTLEGRGYFLLLFYHLLFYHLDESWLVLVLLN